MAHAYSNLTHNYASHAQGVHGAGARTYKPEMATRILLILKNECVGRRNRKTVAELAARVGLNGRAVRDVISDLEKARLVLTNNVNGYFVPETVEEAEEATRRWESQIRNMQIRLDIRRELTADLVSPQPRLL